MGRLLLDVVEERILSLLSVWPGRTPGVIMGALALRKRDLDLALQELERSNLVSAICSMTGDKYYVTLQRETF